MAFYESIIIIRQDVLSAKIDKIVDDLVKIIEDHNGKVIKTEYWGLKQLAHKIKNYKKGHYYFIGIEATKPLLDEIDRKLKLSEDIIRSSIVRVNEINKTPSPLLKTKNLDNGETIDVTSSKAPERKNKNNNKID